MEGDFLKHAADKDRLHRAIDLLPEGAAAILITNCCLHDFDSDEPEDVTTCELPPGSTADYRILGKMTMVSGLGMLETVKMFIAEHQIHGDDDDDAED